MRVLILVLVCLTHLTWATSQATVTTYYKDVIVERAVATFSKHGRMGVQEYFGPLHIVKEVGNIPSYNGGWVALLSLKEERTEKNNRGSEEVNFLTYDALSCDEIMIQLINAGARVVIVTSSNVQLFEEKMAKSHDLTILMSTTESFSLTFPDLACKIELKYSNYMEKLCSTTSMVTFFFLCFFFKLSWMTLHAGLPLYITHEAQLKQLARKILSEMKTFIYHHHEVPAESDTSCAVCLEAFNSTEELRVLPCKHRYHSNCVDAWLIERRFCPLCKYDIVLGNHLKS